MNLSVCILINKWHPMLLRTLTSYKNCSSEILLGINGDFNPDEYFELTKIPNLRLIRLPWQGYGQTKNELAKQAAYDWILSIDSDEVADYELQKSLSQLSLNFDNKIYAIGMKHYLGQVPVKYGAWATGRRKFLRLYNRNHTRWNHDAVHESIVIQLNSDIIRLSGKILHYTSENNKQFLLKNRTYARLSAEKYYLEGVRGSEWKKRVSPLYRFFKEFIFQLGFLDGKMGYDIAKGNAFYTFWKYEYLQKKEKERTNNPKK